MYKLAKFVREITVAPIAAIVINIFIFFFLPNAFNSFLELIAIIFFLGIFPILSYPIQRRFHVIKKDNERDAERTLSFIFCVSGYILGVLVSIIFKVPTLQKLVYFTYFFSGIIMFIFNFGFKIKASGHMCGVAGPIAVAIYLFGWEHALLFIVLLGLVVWSSLKLKRHKVNELFTGFLIPIVALFLSIAILI